MIFCSELHILIIAAGSILYIDSFPIMHRQMCLGSFISIELLFQFLLIHHRPARSIAVSNFVSALIGVMAVFETALASHHARSLRLVNLSLHIIIKY